MDSGSPLRSVRNDRGRVVAWPRARYEVAPPIVALFTGTSGTLGEFRAGMVAALFGAFASVLVGGIGAIVVALLWMKLFPELRSIDTIQRKPD